MQKHCKTKGCFHPVEVIEDEDGPWTSGYCVYCNNRLAEQYREAQEFAYYHPPKEPC